MPFFFSANRIFSSDLHPYVIQNHMSKCAVSFLSEPLWDEKNFNQIQEDVIWTDW